MGRRRWLFFGIWWLFWAAWTPTAFGAVLPASQWETRGQLLGRVYQDMEEDSSLEESQAMDTRFYLDNTWKWEKQGVEAVMNVEARVEGWWGEEFDSQANLFVRDAYVRIKKQRYTLRLGQQTVTWGKLDDFALLDRVSPQDYQWFALFDLQERKLPALMGRYNYYGDNWQLEAVFLPFFKSSQLHFFGSDWSVFGHLKESVANGSFSAAVKDVVRRVVIEEKDRVMDQALTNAQVGLRAGGRWGEVDYMVYFLSVLHSIPVLREKTSTGNTLKRFLYEPTSANLASLTAANPSDEDLVLQREHPRTQIVGLDWETVWGAYGLRGEAAVTFNAPYLREDMAYTQKDTISIGVGVDHTTVDNLYLNFQFVTNYVLDGKALFVQQPWDQQLTGTVRQGFWRDKLRVQMDWAWSPSYLDWMINPEIQYKTRADARLAMGLFAFGGKSTTVFGRYADKGLVYVEWTWWF